MFLIPDLYTTVYASDTPLNILMFYWKMQPYIYDDSEFMTHLCTVEIVYSSEIEHLQNDNLADLKSR